MKHKERAEVRRRRAVSRRFVLRATGLGLAEAPGEAVQQVLVCAPYMGEEILILRSY